MGQVQHRVCNLCEAMCGLWIETEGKQVLSIKSNAEDVLSRGAFCPKSQYLASLYEDPDRLRRPLKRVGQDFVEISWEQAFDEVSERVKALQKKHGTKAIATYLGNPNVHNMGNMLLLPFFLKSLRTPQKYSATSVDQLPHQLVSLQMFGHQLLFPIADVDRTDFMLILGANPVVSNGSLLSAPGLSSRLKGIQKRGGKVVVIDPRYTETASLADEHHFIRPGADAHFLIALLQAMLAKGGPRLRQLTDFVTGLDDLMALLATYDASRVEEYTGIPSTVITDLAERFLAADKALCYGRMGVSTQPYGTLCQWLIYLVNILSGQLDREGGVMFTKPAFDVLDFMAKIGHRGSFARRKSRVRQLPEFSGEFPVATLADEILSPGEGQVKGLFTVAGNPVLSVPQGQKLEEAIRSLELYVAIDFYCNETTRLAHYILPPSSPLQHGHYDIVFNSFAVRNVARYSPPVLPKEAGEKDDWEIFLELWTRIGTRSWWQTQKRKLSLAFLKRFGIERLVDMGLRLGPYKDKRLSCKGLAKIPNGVDLGPLQPSIPQRLFTKDKKIHLITPVLREAWSIFAAAEQEKPRALDRDEFYLIGRRNLRSNNTWMHNFGEIKGKHPCFLLMHEEDGARLGVTDGEELLVERGGHRLAVPVHLSRHIMPGVVSLPHGWGHQKSGVRLRQAQVKGGSSLNDLTDDQAVDRLSGNAALNGQRVRILPRTIS